MAKVVLCLEVEGRDYGPFDGKAYPKETLRKLLEFAMDAMAQQPDGRCHWRIVDDSLEYHTSTGLHVRHVMRTVR